MAHFRYRLGLVAGHDTGLPSFDLALEPRPGIGLLAPCLGAGRPYSSEIPSDVIASHRATRLNLAPPAHRAAGFPSTASPPDVELRPVTLGNTFLRLNDPSVPSQMATAPVEVCPPAPVPRAAAGHDALPYRDVCRGLAEAARAALQCGDKQLADSLLQALIGVTGGKQGNMTDISSMVGTPPGTAPRWRITAAPRGRPLYRGGRRGAD